MIRIAGSLGADRVLAPASALPQSAERLDASGPVRPEEIEIEVEALCLDSTSFAQLASASNGDATALAAAIEAIVAASGKMHNPATGSGGVLVGTVVAAGERYPNPPPPGQQVVTLASLTLTPLELSEVGPVSGESAHVPVRGRAFLPASAAWAPVPVDLPLDTVVAVLDVCGAPSHTRLLAGHRDVVAVLGAGHAGLLSLVAAREAVGPDGVVVAIDADSGACERARSLDVCEAVLQVDLQQPLAALEALAEAGVPAVDLCVLVVNAPRCEMSAILLTRNAGTVLLFSMAVSFTAAALGAEGISSSAQLVVGNGYSPDRGEYALDLVRRDPTLAALLRQASR